LGLPDAEEVFAAALLQDMAVPLLAKEAPDAYNTLFGARSNSSIRLSALEQHVFGWTHAQAAGLMVRNWSLPEQFATLIESHLAIDELVQEQRDPSRLAVALSALLPTTGDPGWAECSAFEQYYQRVCPRSGPALTELLGRIDHEFADFAPLLKLPTPKRSLVECYGEVAAATG
jgi:hypothetical protein